MVKQRDFVTKGSEWWKMLKHCLYSLNNTCAGSDQAESSKERGDKHKAPPLVKELLATHNHWEREGTF